MDVLLWKIGALGDVVMTTPLVRQLRARLPQARIDYLVGKSGRAAIEGNPHVTRVRDFDERILFGAQAWRLPEIVRQLRGYDVVLVLDKHWIFPLLARIAGVPVRAGFRRRGRDALLLTQAVAYGALRHEIDYYLDVAEAAGWPMSHADVELDAPTESAFPCDPRTIVLVNSGGSNANENSRVRRMPDPLFGALVETCAAHHPVTFLGSASEAGDYARFAGPGRTNLCGRTSLAQATAVLRRAARVITTDTGLMHLAGAVNNDVTAVFGPTHPLRKCPPGARWAWGDEALYDPRYELFGAVPTGRYFELLTLDDILHAPQRSRPPVMPVREAA